MRPPVRSRGRRPPSPLQCEIRNRSGAVSRPPSAEVFSALMKTDSADPTRSEGESKGLHGAALGGKEGGRLAMMTVSLEGFIARGTRDARRERLCVAQHWR